MPAIAMTRNTFLLQVLVVDLLLFDMILVIGAVYVACVLRVCGYF